MHGADLAWRAASAAGADARPELAGGRVGQVQTVLRRKCNAYHRLALGAEPEWWILVLEGPVWGVLDAWEAP